MNDLNVFINCPFDIKYQRMFRATIFCIHSCGYVARCVLELTDGSDTRITKLAELIAKCKYGFHDMSRVELDDVNKLPRFNMPFELGLFLGAKYYEKTSGFSRQCIILDSDRYRLQKCLSDLAGNDPKIHSNDPKKLITELRTWLISLPESNGMAIPGPKKIVDNFLQFEIEFPEVCKAGGFDKKNIAFPDYSKIVTTWLTS